MVRAVAVVLLVISLICSSHAWGSSSGGSMSMRRSSSIVRKGGDMSMRWGLKGPQANKPMGEDQDGKLLRDTVPFELRGVSLPAIVFSIGVLLTGSSFAGFFLNEGDGDGSISSLGFVYGIPVFLIGLSLFYAEIKPVVVVTSEAGDRAWESKKTDTLEKIRKDVTRHRYGDDAHLDSTLEALGLKLPQKKFPKMTTITLDETPNKELVFTMEFQSAETPYKVWSEPERVQRYSKYFGPNVDAEVVKVDAEKRLVAIKLTTTSGGGGGGASAIAPAVAAVGASDDDGF